MFKNWNAIHWTQCWTALLLQKVYSKTSTYNMNFVLLCKLNIRSKLYSQVSKSDPTTNLPKEKPGITQTPLLLFQSFPFISWMVVINLTQLFLANEHIILERKTIEPLSSQPLHWQQPHSGIGHRKVWMEHRWSAAAHQLVASGKRSLPGCGLFDTLGPEKKRTELLSGGQKTLGNE